MCNIYAVYIAEYSIPSTGYLEGKGCKPAFVVDFNNYSSSEDDSMSHTLLLHGVPQMYSRFWKHGLRYCLGRSKKDFLLYI